MFHYATGYRMRRHMPDTLDAIYQLRGREFHDRLGWAVDVDEDGREIDRFDTQATLYCWIEEPGGKLAGAMRFLSTAEPHMLADVFEALHGWSLGIRSPGIWECTRFVVDEEHRGWSTPTGLNRATAELLIGGFELAQSGEIPSILGIFYRPMLRVYRQYGWVPTILETRASDRDRRADDIMCGVWHVDDEHLGRMRELTGIREVLVR